MTTVFIRWNFFLLTDIKFMFRYVLRFNRGWNVLDMMMNFIGYRVLVFLLVIFKIYLSRGFSLLLFYITRELVVGDSLVLLMWVLLMR